MIRILLILAVLALAAGPARAQASGEWRTDVPCTAGRNPALALADTAVEMDAPGCVRAWCVTLSGGRRVCSCLGDTTMVTRLEQGGRTVQQWDANYSWMGGFIHVLEGDLDGDARPELVTAQLVTVSNGLGVEYWDVRILDGRDSARPPLRVTVEDFRPEGSFVRPARGGPCRLLATRWDPLRDPRRGEGMYLIGQWMEYRQGRLLHDATRPVVARRLLFSYRHDVPGEPWSQLRDARSQVWTRFPVDLPPIARRVDAGVMWVLNDTLTVTLDDRFGGRQETYPDASGETVWTEETGSVTTWLVDVATARPYPPGYRAATADWLALQPLSVATYQDEIRTVHLLTVGPHPPRESR